MITVERIKCGNGNCYIVSENESSVLIDTCKSDSIDKILHICKPYNIRLILLTHGHFDHAQNAAALSRALNAPAAMHRADLELLSDNNSQPLRSKGLLGKIVLNASLKSFESEKIPPFAPLFLDDGDTLEEYGINAKILHLPGHTDGSIAVDVNEEHLFVGDALMNMFYPTTSMIFHNKAEMLKSAERITSLGKRTIYFGHGKPVPNRNWT
ncbi:MAG: MBL fold metallo-hydrolase [Ruminococcaceae bacterium]|nr:MBL fold metallo-hydrolase [Oscillospiraceae bacterium]